MSATRVLPTQIARGGSAAGWRVPAAAAIALALACLPVSVLFADDAWVGPALVTIATVCGTGAVLRALPVPLVLVPIAQSIAFALVMAWSFSGGAGSLTGVWDSFLSFRDLALDGVRAVRESPAPVAGTPSFLALLAVLVFLAAMLTETLAVGLGLAGLSGGVLLIMAAVPLGIRPEGSSLLLLAGPAIGWLVLLAADHWARVAALPTLGSNGPPRAAHHPWLGIAGLTAASIACTALVLAAAAPNGAETPWLRSWWNTLPGQQSPGVGAAIDPFVDVRSQLGATAPQEVLRYRSSDAAARYLGLVTLESFDGAAWEPYPPTPGEPVQRPAPDAGDGTAIGPSLDIEISALGNRYLPVPDDVATLRMAGGSSGRWVWDQRTGDAVGPGEPATGASYRALTTGASPAPEQLAQAQSQSPQAPQATRTLPESVPVEVGERAAEVVQGATSNYERALALQQWFTGDGGFEYSLNVPAADGRDPLLAFLQDRVGFCQQYATAMAVMSRTLGIPARIVVGFTGGTAQPDGTYVVTSANAHAWPELWFDGSGWVRFEPTPASGAAAITPPAYTPAEPAPSPEPVPAPSAEATTPPPAAADSWGGDAGRPFGDVAGQFLRWACLVALVLGIVALPSAWRRRIRRGRLQRADAGDVLAGWDEVGATAHDAGVPWPSGGTLRQQAQAVEVMLAGRPDGAQTVGAVWRLVAAAEIRQYAPAGSVSGPAITTRSTVVAEPLGEPGGAAVGVEVVRVIAALESLPRSTRLRLLPRSLSPRIDEN